MTEKRDETDGHDIRLCQLIPAVGWHMLTLCMEDGGGYSMLVKPVIAWGLDQDGRRVHPVAVDDLDLMHRDSLSTTLRYGLCRDGHSEVYGNDDATYDDRDDWFAEAVKVAR